MFSVLVIRLRSLRLLRVSGIVMRLRMFLLLITFLKASHSFRNRLLVICKNAYCHNSNFFSDKLVLTSVTPASSAPVLQTPKATSSTLYFDSLTVNAGNGGFLHCIQMDTS